MKEKYKKLDSFLEKHIQISAAYMPIIYIVLYYVFIYVQKNYDEKVVTAFTFIMIFVLIIYLAWLIAYAYYFIKFVTNVMKELFGQYKKTIRFKDGIKALFFALLCLIISPLVFKYVLQNSYPTISKMLGDIVAMELAIIPSITALFGVHYSTTVQQKSHNEDLRLANKPYFSIMADYKVNDENSNILEFHTLEIKNVSNNIGILISVNLGDHKIDFPYRPLPFGETMEKYNCKTNIVSFEDNEIVEIHYKDVLNNQYMMRILLKNHIHGSGYNAQTILSDELVYIKKQDIMEENL